jgi:hypothetical protein
MSILEDVDVNFSLELFISFSLSFDLAVLSTYEVGYPNFTFRTQNSGFKD